MTQDADLGMALWAEGWRRAHPPSSVKGIGPRALGETRLMRALACVDEDGRRLRPWPTPVRFADAASLERVRLDNARHERDLLGVVFQSTRCSACGATEDSRTPHAHCLACGTRVEVMA